MAATEQRKIQIISDGKSVNASLKEMQAASRVLYNQLQKLPAGSDDFVKKSAELKKVNSRMNEVKGEIRGTEKAMGGLKDEFMSSIPFAGQLQKFSSVFSSVTGSVTGTSKALNIFKIALASTGIGLIVVALGSLVSYLTSTQEGMDKVTAVTRPLSTLFQRLIGVIQNLGKMGFDALAEAVQNPKQAFMDFVDFIKKNLMNRLKSVAVGFNAINMIISGDVKEGFKQLGNAAIQGFTGIENGIDKVGKAVESTSGFIKESIDQGTQLDQLTKQIERAEIELTKNRARLNAEYEKAKEIAQDQSLTEEQRIDAAKRAQNAQNELLNQEQALLDKKIERMELEQSFNDTSREDEKELAQLVAQRTQFEATAARKRASARNLENTVAKQIAAEEDKRAQAAIKREEEKQQRLAALQANYQAKRQETETAIEQLRIATMENQTERELAQLDYEHQQKIAKIETQREEILLNDALTEQQRQEQFALFREQEALLEQEREAQEKAILDEKRQQEMADEMANLDERQQMEMLKLQEHFLLVNSTEKEEYKARLAVEREFLQQKLSLLKEQGKLETIEAQKLTNQLLAIDNEEKAMLSQNESRLQSFMSKVGDQKVQVVQNTLGATADALMQDEQIRKKYAGEIKALQIAEATMAGIVEVANIWQGAAQLGPILGPIIGAIQTGIAIGRTAFNISQIRSQKFAEGGATGDGKTIQMTYDALSNSYSWKGGSTRNIGSFASGGNINQASTGLIGEAGPEWVAPNWMLKSPAYADTIGWLESERQRKGMRAFAAGGQTLGNRSSSNTASPSQVNPQLMQMEMMNLRKDFARLANNIERWPKELRVINNVQDTRSAMQTLNEIESDSKISRSA